MSDNLSRRNVATPNAKRQKILTSRTTLKKRPSSTSVSASFERERLVTTCLRLSALACYTCTVAGEAAWKASEAMAVARRSTDIAHQLTEVSDMLTKKTRNSVKMEGEVRPDLADIYAASPSRPLTFDAFQQVMTPSATKLFFDKVSKEGLGERATNRQTSHTDLHDVLSQPDLRRIKSTIELSDAKVNMMSATDRRRKERNLFSCLSPSPLLSKEDAENIRTSPSSSKLSQYSGFQLHKYSIKRSKSARSSLSSSSQ